MIQHMKTATLQPYDSPISILFLYPHPQKLNTIVSCVTPLSRLIELEKALQGRGGIDVPADHVGADEELEDAPVDGRVVWHRKPQSARLSHGDGGPGGAERRPEEDDALEGRALPDSASACLTTHRRGATD